jgi:Outer membrane protein beta-barrel domain
MIKSTLTLLFLWLNTWLFAQTSPFKVGATLGVNLAQIDGDKQFGYQKKGITAGLKGGIVFNKKWEVSTELRYNVKGTEPNRQEKKTNKRLITMDLHYAEIPILLKYTFVKSEQGYDKWQVFGGISYGRLIKSKYTIQRNDGSVDTSETNVLNQLGFKTADVSALIGASFYFSPRLGMSIRHSTSLTQLYKNTNPSSATNLIPAGYEQFRNYFLSIQLIYDFVSPKFVKNKKKETPQ